MKTKIRIVITASLALLIVSAAMLIVGGTTTAVSVEPSALQSVQEEDPCAFKHLIGDVVKYEKDWWEITARLEQEHMVDGNVYRWYRLTRPFEGEIEHKWVWSGYIDKVNTQGVNASSADCCPPPPCPHPPC